MLGLLALAPANGYELNRRFDQTLRNAWHASHSQIYPELAKLQQAGMIEVVGEGPRGSRTYAVTDAGRAEMRRWVVEEEANRVQRNETMVRWFLACLLEPEQRREFFRGELAVIEEHNAQLRGLRDELEAAGRRGGFRPVLELGIRETELMREWLQEQSA